MAKKTSPNRVKKYAAQFGRTAANKQRNIARQKKFEQKCSEKRAEKSS